MIAARKPVKLETGRGRWWVTVLTFDAADGETADAILAATEQLARASLALGQAWRVARVEDDGTDPTLMRWTEAGGWAADLPVGEVSDSTMGDFEASQ